ATRIQRQSGDQMTVKQWLAIRKEAGIPKRLRLRGHTRGHSTLMRPPPTCRGQRNEAIGKTDGSLNSIYCPLTSAQIAIETPDCRINNAIIDLHSNNRAPAQTCLPIFGSQGSQETLPDECAARVTG